MSSSRMQQNSWKEVSWHGRSARCYCDLPAVERTTWTYGNPGRRFLNPNKKKKKNTVKIREWKGK